MCAFAFKADVSHHPISVLSVLSNKAQVTQENYLAKAE
jgi:hypothetical protein